MFQDYRFLVDPEIQWLAYGVMCSNPGCIMHQKQKFYLTENSAVEAWIGRYKDE